jgi:hypothetical protein
MMTGVRGVLWNDLWGLKELAERIGEIELR